MPKLSPVFSTISFDSEAYSNNETKPSEIIQQIISAAKRRWSSPLLIDSLSSLSTTTEQQSSKPMNISVKRNRRQDKKEDTSSRSRSVDSSLNDKQPHQTVSSSTDSAVYSMSDISSSIISTTNKKSSHSLKDISHIFHYFTLSNEKYKSKTLTNIRRKKLRKKLTNETFISPADKDDDIYERISNSSICFIDQSPVHEIDFAQQTSLLKSRLMQHENVLKTLKQQINQVDQQLSFIQEDSSTNNQKIKLVSLSNQNLIKRRHTFNSLFDLNSLCTEKNKLSSTSLFALQLL